MLPEGALMLSLKHYGTLIEPFYGKTVSGSIRWQWGCRWFEKALIGELGPHGELRVWALRVHWRKAWVFRVSDLGRLRLYRVFSVFQLVSTETQEDSGFEA